MKEMVNIPESLKANESGFESLANIWRCALNLTEPEIAFDFASCRDIDANLASLLGAMLDKLVDYGHLMYVVPPKNRVTLKSLARIGFLRAFEVSSNIEEKENFIRYRRFEVGESVDFKKYIQEDLFKKKRFPHCSEKATEKILENIYEVFANAVTHGNSTNIYCCGESHERNGIPTLDFAISNMGLTVAEKVNNYMRNRGRHEYDDAEAIKWAFIEGNTTKSVPGGLGLAILKEFISLNKGRIQFVSGKGVFELDGDKSVSYILNYPIPGTVVNLSFNCADKNSYYLKSEVTDLQDLL